MAATGADAAGAPRWHVAPATASDLAALAALGADAWPPGWTAEAVRAELDRPEARVYVLRPAPGAAPAGFLLARVAVDELHVLLVAVAPPWRRRGGATALLAEALRDARRSGLVAAHLEVRAGNAPALALYRRHGFLAVGRRPRYYEGREDAVLMTLPLVGGSAR